MQFFLLCFEKIELVWLLVVEKLYVKYSGIQPVKIH